MDKLKKCDFFPFQLQFLLLTMFIGVLGTKMKCTSSSEVRVGQVTGPNTQGV